MTNSTITEHTSQSANEVSTQNRDEESTENDFLKIILTVGALTPGSILSAIAIRIKNPEHFPAAVIFGSFGMVLLSIGMIFVCCLNLVTREEDDN